ncbi:phenylalanine--tRNA ligase subunit alpha [SAR202 cluster bacterium AD-802-E10_MRT_200m]|nr:phenylalanine--tRNA ligase subunit alpha [SAR202 cluster bacterium AD-802-E10_MRT_200m]
MAPSSSHFIESLNEIKAYATIELGEISDLEKLEIWRITYLGRADGHFTRALKSIKSLPEEQKRSAGSFANEIKSFLEAQFLEKQQDLTIQGLNSQLQEEGLDISLPGRPSLIGRLHPTTKILREACAAFDSMGFQTIEGPEVEWELFNFGLLNIPKDHPARDMWNTIWIDNNYNSEDIRGGMLLRTHTSPMQARILQNTKPPIRVVIPGRCYRYEATDATHEWHFFQLEGLAVDEGITFAHLKGTLYEFARQTFGSQRKVRFRCDYFPFVEPGVEMAIDCFKCEGRGCRICQNTGWIEIMGAGMVHPKVLEMVGYDSSKYTGFAFGIGVERIAMLKFGIDDIRYFYENDLRFLKQF